MKYNEIPPSDPTLKAVIDEMITLYVMNIMMLENNFSVLHRDISEWEAEDAYLAIHDCEDNITQIKLFFRDIVK